MLSSWKAKGLFSIDQLAKEEPIRNDYRKQSQDERNEEFKRKVRSYYFNLREKAQDRAEHYRKIAEADNEFSTNEEALRSTEIQLAKAEALGGDTEDLSNKLISLRKIRSNALKRLNLTEAMLVPQYRCNICKDTGFDHNGNVCECYKKFVENASGEEKLENILDVYSKIEL